MMPVETLRPEAFNNDTLTAFFSLKNEGHAVGGAKIKGINLGFNTDEAPDIIKENRQTLLHQFGIDPEWTAFANQVHSNRVKEVTEGGTYAETDGLITRVPGLALAIQVADCAAILIADPSSKIIAAVHAGWRGAVGDIIPITLDKMQKGGARPERCVAYISPCISQKNFEVGEEVADQFPDRFVDYQSFEKPHINLKAFLVDQLSAAGLNPKNVEINPDCTVACKDDYYSYRREGDNSGRMMAVIKLKEGAT